MANILIACEKSRRVAAVFEKLGHNAISCDILPAEQLGKHIQDDVLNHLDDGWDIMIAFPPCTHFSKAGGWCWKYKDSEIKESLKFIEALWEAPIDRICIENPTGWLNTHWKPPSQIIHPYYFGDPWLKETCLWLKNLPTLTYVLKDDMFYQATAVEPKGNWVKPGNKRPWRRFDNVAEGGQGNTTDRSRTFPMVAQAMGMQWGEIV